MIVRPAQPSSRTGELRVRRFARGGSLGIEVFQGPRLDSTGSDKRIDLRLLESNDSTEAVRRQLPLVDQAVERPWREAKRCSCLLRGEPVTIRVRHDTKHNTLSAPLSVSRMSLALMEIDR
jgi:hypothetical protein